MSGNGGDSLSGALPLGLAGLRLRLVVGGAALLCYLLLLESSVAAGLAGRAWWGIAAELAPDGGLVVTWVEPNGLAWGHGLRVGSIITEADGQPAPTDLERLNAAGELRATGADGRAFLLRAPTVTGLPHTRGLNTAAISVFFALAGAFVYLQASTRRQARVFAVLCASAAVALVTTPAGVLGQPWAVRLTFIGVTLAPTAFASFFAMFPVDRLARRGPGLAIAHVLFLLPVAILTLYAGTLALHLPLFDWAERVLYVNMVLGFASGLALLLRSYFGDCTPRMKQQLRIAVGGTILGTLPFLVLSVLPNVLAVGQQQPVGAEGYIVDPEITVLGTVLIPLSFSYAILKHQIIRSDVVIRRSVVYAAVTLATTVCYLLTISIFQALYQVITGQSSATTIVLSALLVALAVEPVRRATQSWVERVFFSDIYAYRQLLNSPGLLVNTILSPEELITLVVGTITAGLPVSRISLFVAERGGSRYHLRWDRDGWQSKEVVLDRHHPVIRQLEGGGDATIVDTPLVVVSWAGVRLPPSDGGHDGDAHHGNGHSRNGRDGNRKAATWKSAETVAEIRHLDARVLVPLRAGGQVLAILALGERSDGEPYSGADLEFLDSAAARYAVALDNALLHETVRRQADTDALTGAYNHRALLERLEVAIAEARDSGKPLAVLMMDVDSFKFYNDTYGHPMGDKVLVAIAEALRSVCRAGDVLGRYGGDEFVIVLSNTDREGAYQMADEIAVSAEQLAFQADGIGPISLSLTIGAAAMPEDGETPLQLIAAADIAMYHRKRSTTLAASTLPDISELPSPQFRALIAALEQKDGFVVAHSERVAHWAVRLARALGLSERDQQALRIAGLLHDVGKLGVPDRILNKVEPLTSDERKLVEQHVELSLRLLSDVPNRKEVLEAVAHHHERWDGLGYPQGLRGEETPLFGRILAAADVYSAMTTDRPYRSRLTQAEAAERLKRQAGAQLDPHIVRALLDIVYAGDGACPTGDSQARQDETRSPGSSRG